MTENEHETEPTGNEESVLVVASVQPVDSSSDSATRLAELERQIAALREQIAALSVQIVDEMDETNEIDEEDENDNESENDGTDRGTATGDDRGTGDIGSRDTGLSSGTAEKETDTAPEVTHWLFRKRFGRHGS